MFSRVLKAVSLATSAVLLGSVLTVVSLVTPPTSSDQAAQAAPPASAFDPGLIISDAVMFDYGAMGTAEIQAFLESKVPACSPTAPVPCLRDYHVDTRSIAAVANRCTGDIVGAANQSAAEVINTVARACQVNPKVLLVTLQKEQGLVTSTSPTDGKYKIAMGYGCPDTAPCDSDYYGFFNQVYQAAYAFNKYTKSPDQYTAYQPGTRQIKYNPKDSCGTATVDIQTKATGALYFYTPYVPNAAALANPYATGDDCSSYGNRNFWNYFNDWFGSPVGGSFLIDTADGHTYVLVDGHKWELPADRVAALAATLSPLGEIGRVSNAYADGFPTAGTFGNIVTDSLGAVFLLDSGRRFSLTDCNEAGYLGLPCSSVPVLTDDMLAFFPNVGPLSSYVTTGTGASYVLGGGARREVLDAASATAEGISLPVASALSADTIDRIPYGTPIARRGVVISLRGTTNRLFVTSSSSYRMSDQLVAELRLEPRLGAPVGSLDEGSFAFFAAPTEFHGLYRDWAGVSHVLTKKGAATVTDPSEWGTTFVGADVELTSLLTASGETFSAPLFVKDLTTSRKFLLKSGTQRPVSTTKQMKALAKSAHASTTAVSLAGDTVAMLGKPLLNPGTVVKATKKSTALWIIDGAAKKRSLTAAQAKELTGSTAARVVAQSTLDGYVTVTGTAKPGLTAGGLRYVADNGVLRLVSASAAKQYGSKYGFGAWDVTTVAALRHGAPIGRTVKFGSKYYQVTNGKKVHVSASAAKKLAAAGGTTIQPIDKYLASLLITK